MHELLSIALFPFVYIACSVCKTASFIGYYLVLYKSQTTTEHQVLAFLAGDKIVSSGHKCTSMMLMCVSLYCLAAAHMLPLAESHQAF